MAVIARKVIFAIPGRVAREGSDWVERYERLPDASGADGAVQVWLRAREGVKE